MKISLLELKHYITLPDGMTDRELIDLIGSRLVEVEEVIDLAPKYRNAYIVKVVTAEKIPDTHLTLCQIDAGAHIAEFFDGETVQVVCGAPNVHAGMLAVWLAPGAIVPSTFGNEDFRLGTRNLRGYESNGMLAAVDELDLGADHEGIAEIHPYNGQPGDDFAEAFELNDIIIDVENKSLTHRPDCFGLIGFAREVSGILGQKFEEPELFADLDRPVKITPSDELTIDVEIADAELCPRYSCAIFDQRPDNQSNKYLTPMKVFLAKAGMRTVSPLVDLTNYLMLKTGQPLHAFDYDKLVAVGGTKDAKIIVRAAKPGEELQLLDGKTIQCSPDDILITSNNTPVALAGAMGGKNTEIDASTKRVILESATFSLYHLRKTQMAHGIFSEAITRFTKGQPAAMTLPVLMDFLRDRDEAPLAIVDQYPEKQRKIVVKITTGQINRTLGTEYNLSTITKTLENVGFVVEADKTANDSLLKITVPVWRTDIHIPEDIIEEVGRLLGYDNIPLKLPERPFTGTTVPSLWSLKSELRAILSDRLAMHELLTYSFVSKDLLAKVGQDPAESYEITNALSPDLQCFRQQIAPSLLSKVRENIKTGHENFTLYELNQVTRRSFGMNEDGTPLMRTNLGIVSLGDFYHIKAQLLAATRKGLRITLEYAQMTPNSRGAELFPYLEPVWSANILLNGEIIGAFGEVKSAVLRRLKIDQPVSACELNLDVLLDLPREITPNLRISRFPFVERDLTLKVASDAAFGRFYNAIAQTLTAQSLVYYVTPASIYQATPEDPSKNISFHLKFSSPEKTLEQSEISAIMDKVTKEVVGLGAEIV